MNLVDTIYKKSAGGIVYTNGRFLTLNITKHGEIVFPKGTIEADETPEQAAIREVLEETGYHTRIVAPLGEVSYEFDEDDGKHYKKTVYHFLLALTDPEEQATPQREAHENADGMENLWLSKDEALQQLTHENSRDILQRALAILESHD